MRLLHAVSISACLSIGLTSTAPAEPMFMGLGDLPGGVFESAAEGVSADGSVVVGYSRHASGREAVRWTSAGGLVPLGDIAGGSVDSSASGVSADGSVVVGTGAGPDGYEAFHWTAAEGMVGLGNLGGRSPYSHANDVSADGWVIVGGASSFCPICEMETKTEAFRWTAAEGMVGLGGLPHHPVSPGGSGSSGVSADGSVVVGWANLSQAFRWTTTEGMVGLGGLPGFAFSSAKDVSADGSVVVGFATGRSGREAFRWTEETGMVGLGDLPGGEFDSYAFAVSDDGSMVLGFGTSASGWEAFIWDPAHGMRELDEVLVEMGVDLSGWDLIQARDVSADGMTIVGSGINPDGSDEGWIARIDWACSDGIDNDDDGLVDHPDDPGCAGSYDLSERSSDLACDDGEDNDGDGLVDFDPVTFADPGDSITLPAGSGDPGCKNPSWFSEEPLCQDGIDNDGDGMMDYDAGLSRNGVADSGGPDPACVNPFDNREGPCGLGAELALLLPPLIWLWQRRGRVRP